MGLFDLHSLIFWGSNILYLFFQCYSSNICPSRSLTSMYIDKYVSGRVSNPVLPMQGFFEEIYTNQHYTNLDYNFINKIGQHKIGLWGRILFHVIP